LCERQRHEFDHLEFCLVYCCVNLKSPILTCILDMWCQKFVNMLQTKVVKAWKRSL
jgi:hypothetical protein